MAFISRESTERFGAKVVFPPHRNLLMSPHECVFELRKSRAAGPKRILNHVRQMTSRKDFGYPPRMNWLAMQVNHQ